MVEGAGGQAGARGRRSAAVIDPEALGDVLTAQWASPERRAALLAAADVAAVQEDHLGLRGESRASGLRPGRA